MIQRLAILSGLILSTTCAILPLVPIHVPVFLQLQTQQPQQPQNFDDSNYNFAYDVNDERTRDIKSQQESKSGGTIIGQYSLIQPDGIRRTVDYLADDHRGFRAQIKNERNNQPQQDSKDDSRNNIPWTQNDQDLTSQWSQSDDTPQWSQDGQNVTPQWQENAPNSPALFSQNGATVIAQWQQIVPNYAIQWQQRNSNLNPQENPHLTQSSQNAAPQRSQNNQDDSNNATSEPASVSRTSIVQSTQTRRIVHPLSNSQKQWE